MADGRAGAVAELIDEAVALAHRKIDSAHAGSAERFLRNYYRRVPPGDLEERDVVDVYGAAMAHWSLAHQRQPGTPIVRVATPQLEQHGWRSTHSVVEIVTDDMPFLVDSVTMELSRLGLGIHLVIYPTMPVVRDEGGRLVDVLDEAAEGGEATTEATTEAFVHVEIDRQSDPVVVEEITGHITRVLSDVRAAVEDWPRMREQLATIQQELEERPPPVDEEELAETQRFLSWLDDDHFTFLGYRAYDLITREGEGDVLASQPDTGLGILKHAPPSVKRFSDQPPEVRDLARERTLLSLTKANSRATVHRPGYLDYIGIKRFGPDGDPVGEWRFLGLYTSRVYSSKPQDIPVVRRKVDAVLQRAGFPADSHDAKDLVAILESYPRDELFDISTDELFDIAMGVLGLQERRQVRLFVRRDRFGRYFSCLVFVPRDRYNTQTRYRLQEILSDAFEATKLEHTVLLSESVLARLHFVVHAREVRGGLPDVRQLERRLAEATRSWTDDLGDALLDAFGEERATKLAREFADAFPAAYREDYLAGIAVGDIERLLRLEPDGDLAMSLYRPVEAPEGWLRFKLYRSGSPTALSEVLPLLENFGVEVIDQRPYEITPADGQSAWIYDFGLKFSPVDALDSDRARAAFTEAFARVWAEDSENDGFNRLVLCAGLDWRDVTMLRSYSKYLRQTAARFSQAYMEDALAGNPDVTRLLRRLFHARFHPEQRDEAAAAACIEEVEAALDDVASLDEDRILRSFLSAINATLRTNYFQPDVDGNPKAHIALKFDPASIPDLPRPLPAFEIFVYSRRTEGVHLRVGEVARGGLRWSDRREDFRTEILGLMKAQTVKNAVIVPEGAKGGFVVKASPSGDAQADRAEVAACYRTFIRGLLDVTDNIVEGTVVPPQQVVRYDKDDPYLVVAADKGTATFSDTANSISEEVGFWLGDAFASGGSAGYDHKAMGITARGAWVSVQRHFRELGVDVQTTPFTVVGIGDMSGDVFGNGMLLSHCIRLVGAFDHRHIFLDPDPDLEQSYAERQRLFELPRSSWADYDEKLISEGGGVWPRTAKSIPLSPQVRELLDVDAGALTPDALISAMLRAPVDLLWNGGIGTYVKATAETHAEVGDKATDRLRVDAPDLRCKVVGEGGNLGFTQRARVEFALQGGKINTDAIDNSAGVDCSDHEVNIKILLNAMVEADDLTRKQRNELLVEMTDEVAQLVLASNDQQTQALTNSVANAAPMVDVQRRYIQQLEQRGLLDRELEFLPSDEELIDRRNKGKGLVRPEFAVLIAYTKTILGRELLGSDIPEDPWLSRELVRYFPSALRERFAGQMLEHRLRREIVATQVANALVNDAGITFLYRLSEETGAIPTDIVRAYTVSRDVFDYRGLQAQVRTLDNKIAATIQTHMLLETRKLVERGTRWLLRNRHRPLDIEPAVLEFGPGVARVSELLPNALAGVDREAAEEAARQLEKQDVPGELAQRIACLETLFSALDIVAVAASDLAAIPTVTETYFALGEYLHLDWLREQIGALPRDSRWDTLARDALREDFFTQHSRLTAAVLRATEPDVAVADRLEGWLKRNGARVRRCEQMLTEIQAASAPDLAKLSVALREIRNLVTAMR